jgi:predicted phage terminase large subunit-like protein
MVSSDRRLLLLKRKRAILKARESLIDFTMLMMPDPNNVDDPDFSNYSPQKFHRVIGAGLEEIESAKYRRLMINIGPRFGKTTLASAMYPAWYIGRHPERSIIVATYNETYSWDLGRKIRDIMQTPQYRQVFPDLQIKKKSAAVNRVETTDGGVVFCVGRGSAVTGRGAHTILLDDPLKDRREADSVVIRDGLWSWYTQVLRTRLMNKYGTVVIIQTRWNEDDLVGRLIDPLNPYYSHDEAKLWRKIELPALAEENDILGRAEGEALWPERFDAEYLNEIKMSDPRGFMSLYQCRPSPREGAFFRHADLVPYNSMKDLPAHDTMRFYAASDHAVTLAKHGDKTCLMVVGVDTTDHVWIMPDVVWLRLDSAGAVEGMLVLIQKYSPAFWWAEKGAIEKSIGPFLRKRMLEKRVFCVMDPIAPANDKEQRAQSIQARSAMRMVHFPTWTRWWAEAQDQILKFPNGAKDDFVDTLSLIGLGLSKMRSRNRQPKPKEVAQEGTFAALWKGTKHAERRERQKKALSGWL